MQLVTVRNVNESHRDYGRSGDDEVPIDVRSRSDVVRVLTSSSASFALSYWLALNGRRGLAAQIAACARARTSNSTTDHRAIIGEQPIAKLGDVVDRATDKPFKLPANVRDLDGVLKAVLDAERTSMRSY
jgi:hypothetical protein